MTTATEDQLKLHCIDEQRVEALFTLRPLSGDCIHVEARSGAGNDGRPSLTVNGVELKFWARFYIQTDGSWDWVDYEKSLSYVMEKPWDTNQRFEDASRVAVKKVRLLMIPFVENWAKTDEGHQALCEAEIKSITVQRETKKNDLENALLTVERIRGEIMELTAKLASVK